jgi:CheY-like chemotaxis protein
MATYKIMLVEDDNNLRAIYGDRLLAEGYEIVAARDGEEALAMAVKEKPNLIISDVMMPKISGFDMLDILRTTPETKDVKVIMMTALSQAEDKLRADKLGADKYLVKSQVTLEDVARVVHEVLGDTVAEEVAPEVVTAPAEPVIAPAPTPLTNPDPMGMSTPAPVMAEPVIAPAPIVAVAPEPVAVAPAPTPLPEPAAAPMPAETTGGQRVIQPINTIDPNAPPKIYELYEKEMAAQNANEPVLNPPTGVVVEAHVAPAPEQLAPPAIQQPSTPPTPGQSFDPNSVAL